MKMLLIRLASHLPFLKDGKLFRYTKNTLINIGGRIRAGKLFSFSYDSCDIAMWIIEEEIPQDLKIMDNVL